MAEKINIKNISKVYKWPFLVQALLGVIFGVCLLLGGMFFIISDQDDKLKQEIQRESTIKLEFSNKAKQAVNLNLYKQQLLEITNNSEELLRQLPNRSEVEKLLVDINQAGAGRGLKFELFKPNKEIISEYYAELPIDIRLKGTFETLGGFVEDLSKLSRVVILKDMKINKDANGLLVLNAQARTFRYLDPEEIRAREILEEEKNKSKRPNRRRAK